MLLLTSKTPWRQRPSGLVEIDRSSPLSAGIAAWWPVSAAPHRDGVTKTLSTTDVGRIGTEYGWALPFSGAAGINCGTRADLGGLGVFTAAVWVRDVVGTASKRLLQVGDNTNPPYLQIVVFTESNVVKVGTANTTTAYSTSGSTSVVSGGWHLVVGTRDATTLSVYTDGRLENSTAVTGGMLNQSQNTSIGYSTAFGENSTANIGDCAIWNRALSPAEVWSLYDPATRWSLYQPIVRKTYFDLAAGGGGATFVPQVIMVL